MRSNFVKKMRDLCGFIMIILFICRCIRKSQRQFFISVQIMMMLVFTVLIFTSFFSELFGFNCENFFLRFNNFSIKKFHQTPSTIQFLSCFTLILTTSVFTKKKNCRKMFIVQWKLNCWRTLRHPRGIQLRKFQRRSGTNLIIRTCSMEFASMTAKQKSINWNLFI